MYRISVRFLRKRRIHSGPPIGRGHAPAARFACRASSHKGRVSPVRAGPAREGGVSRRPRMAHAPCPTGAGTRAHGAFRLQGKLAQGPRFPCASGPRPLRRRQPPSPHGSCTVPDQSRGTRPRRVSLARQARTRAAFLLCERASPAKAASDAVPVWLMHRTARSRDTRPRRVSLAGQARTGGGFSSCLRAAPGGS